MSGLIKDNLISALMTEIAWLQDVVLELCNQLGYSSYTAHILKHRCQPEEIQAFEEAVFLLGPERNTATIEDLESRCITVFVEQTGKEWMMHRDVLATLFQLHLQERYNV